MRPWLIAPLLVAVTSTCLSAEPHSGKKLIEWGWDEPDTQFIRENIEKMEEYPFDGLVFHVVSSKGGNFTWEMWGSRRFAIDEFRHAIDNLKATKFRRFTERFLRVNVTPGDVNWFDDEAWDVVVANAAVAAQVAEQGGCRGFMFDVEQYNESPFDYGKQKRRDGQSFEAYQAVVRRRGRQWMEAVNGHFPDVTILLTFGYRLAQPPESKSRSEAHYSLLADFLDGMLDGCSQQTKLVDAWEYSYPYTQQSQFDEARTAIREKAIDWTAAPDKYRRHVTAGFGLWMDCRWREQGWNLDDFSKNYFTPQAFRSSVEAALRASDQYVWIYTEQPRWWTGERLPAEYVAALREARSAASIVRGDDAPWVSLFDGKTLDGWTRQGGYATYEAKDGMIVGTTADGSKNTFLCKGPFSDFVLELEVLCDTPLNSGVQIRSHVYEKDTPQVSKPERIREKGEVYGYQCEIADAAGGSSGNFWDEGRRTCWLDDFSKKPEAQKAFKENEWNHYRIVAQGDRIRSWVNGVACADFRDDMDASGFIGLQVHGIKKDTGPYQVRWRNIRIRELKPGEDVK